MTGTDAPPMVEGEPPAPLPTADPTGRQRLSERGALFVFGAFVAVALPVLLFEVGSYHWFLRDDWFFLTGRRATSVDDLFRPHNVHWSTVPVLAYRGLWRAVGLRSYVPYQACVVALHLTAVVLLRIIMRRAGAGAWLATAAASSFVLFGPGAQNILWAFQIGFTGSLVFGLVQLLLADHDGPVDRRDWLGIGAGALALMSSGTGVTMVIVVGVATLLRRGWRVAALHTAPLAALFGLWVLTQRPDFSSPTGRPPIEVMLRWLRSGQTATFLALGRFQVVAAALAIVLIVGLGLAFSAGRGRWLRGRAAMPVALLIGGVVFPLITVQGRWYAGVDTARTSRYVHIGAALALPALTVAAGELGRRWRVLTPVLVAVFLVALPTNATNFRGPAFGPQYFDSEERVVRAAVRMSFAREVPRDVRPIPDVYRSRGLTIGFLLNADRAGKLRPPTGPIPRALVNELKVRLGVAQRVGEVPTACRSMNGPVHVRPRKGTILGILSPVTISTVQGGKPTSDLVPFEPREGPQLTIELDGLDLRIAPARDATSLLLCREP